MYPRLKIESDNHETIEIETLPVDFMMRNRVKVDMVSESSEPFTEEATAG